MEKIISIIERNEEGIYYAYMDNNTLPFGLLGEGKTVAETIEDFYNSRDEMKELFEEEGKEFPDIDFIFKYDIASFLQHYSNRLSLSGLEKITGINQGQLSHYITGHRKPGKRTVEKIEKALHAFAKELSQVKFV